MIQTHWLKRISWLTIFLLLIFVASDIQARRGGGGGRNFSSRSPARSGSFGKSRSSYSKSSSRNFSKSSYSRKGSFGEGGSSFGKSYSKGSYTKGSTFGQRSYGKSYEGSKLSQRQPTTRDVKSRGEYKSEIESKTKDIQGGGSKDWEQAQKDRQDWKDQSREDWQDYGQERQEDRQEYGSESREDWQEYGDDWHNEYHDYDEWNWDDDDAWEYVAAGVAIGVGTALTISAINSLSCSMTTVYVGGVTYYQCGSYWYNQAYRSGEVVYIVVDAPPGYY